MGDSERKVGPGHFELELPINQSANIDKVAIAKLKELRHDLKSRLGRPEELAILHMMGVISFRLGNYGEALWNFQDIIVKDPENLNALSNQTLVSNKLSREAGYFKAKLEELFDESGDDAPSDGSSRRRRLRNKARCLAEQAYAYSCDIHIDRIGERMYEQANILYKDAIQLANDLVNPKEIENWNFCMAKNAHKIFDFLSYKDNIARASEALTTAETLFFEIAQSQTGDLEFRWESWRHLADMIRATKKRRDFKFHPFRPELKAKEDPEMCMAKAAELAPQNPKLWARYANFVYSMKGKDCFKRAMDYLQRSLTLDASGDNYYAYTTGGKICLEHYKHHLEESIKHPDKYPPSVKHLENAQLYYEQTLEIRETPWDYSYLGETHHLLAKFLKSKSKGPAVILPHLEKSQTYFKKGEECQNGKTRPTMYRVKGICLFEIGEYDAAVEAFSKAVDVEPTPTHFTGNFSGLLQVYLHKLQLAPDPLGDTEFLEEIASQLKKAKDKYSEKAVEKHTTRRLKPTYGEKLKLMADYCKRNGREDLYNMLRPTEEPNPHSSDFPDGGIFEEEWSSRDNDVNEEQPQPEQWSP